MKITRLLQTAILRQVAQDRVVVIIGRPNTIETNMPSHSVEVVILVDQQSIPEDAVERAKFLQSLVVFIEHSDGDKVLNKVVIVPYTAAGILTGAKFTVDKFSTFTLLHMEGWQEYHQAYIVGYPDGTFKPDRSITRAEMAAILARVHGPSREAEGDTEIYPDVATDHWARAAIGKAIQGGLLSSYPDGTFQPEKAITRAEMAAIISRWLYLSGSGSHQFTDISGYREEQAIAQVKEAGIFSGYPDGTYRPEQGLTRTEAVVVINRILNRGPLYGVSEPAWPDVPSDCWAFGHIEEAS